MAWQKELKAPWHNLSLLLYFSITKTNRPLLVLSFLSLLKTNRALTSAIAVVVGPHCEWCTLFKSTSKFLATITRPSPWELNLEHLIWGGRARLKLIYCMITCIESPFVFINSNREHMKYFFLILWQNLLNNLNNVQWFSELLHHF